MLLFLTLSVFFGIFLFLTVKCQVAACPFLVTDETLYSRNIFVVVVVITHYLNVLFAA